MKSDKAFIYLSLKSVLKKRNTALTGKQKMSYRRFPYFRLGPAKSVGNPFEHNLINYGVLVEVLTPPKFPSTLMDPTLRLKFNNFFFLTFVRVELIFRNSKTFWIIQFLFKYLRVPVLVIEI